MKITLLIIAILSFQITFLGQTAKSPLTESVEGIVTDFLGVPWEKVRVRLRSKGEVLRRENGGVPEMVERIVETDKVGRYSFSQLPEGNYEVTLLGTSGGFVEETKTTGVLFDGITRKVDFGVEVGAITQCEFSIGGIVYGSDGKAFEGAKITVINGFNQRKLPTATTAKNGSYSIDICGVGQYVVLLNTPNFEIQTQTVVIASRKYVFKQTDFRMKPLPDETLNWRR